MRKTIIAAAFAGALASGFLVLAPAANAGPCGPWGPGPARYNVQACQTCMDAIRNSGNNDMTPCNYNGQPVLTACEQAGNC
jgi:hypothetical protein